MACLVSSVIIILPPYLFFKFNKLLAGVFKNRKEYPLFQVAYPAKQRWNILAMTFEHVADDPHILQPLPLRTIFQSLVLSFLERLKKQMWIIHHLPPHPSSALLVMP